MNKIYRLVWNAVIRWWLVPSKLARKGKTGRGSRRLIIASGFLVWNAQKGAERGTGTFYTLANLNHDFVKPGHVDIGRDSVREKYASTWMETGMGMQLPTGPSGYLYTEARYEKELGHTQHDGWQGTFRYKYTWK